MPQTPSLPVTGPFQAMNRNGFIPDALHSADASPDKTIVATALAASTAAYQGLKERDTTTSSDAVAIRPLAPDDWVDTGDGRSYVLCDLDVENDRYTLRDVASGAVTTVYTRPKRTDSPKMLAASYAASCFAHARLSTVACSSEGSGMHPHVLCTSDLWSSAKGTPTLVLGCRGSVVAGDWIADFTFAKPAGYSDKAWQAHVHRGFLERSETIPVEPLAAHLARGGAVLITGHSLGSAVAELVCLRLIMHLHATNDLASIRDGRLTFIGFASPTVGPTELGTLVRDTLCNDVFHHMQSSADVVPLFTNLSAALRDDAFGKRFAELKKAAKVAVGGLVGKGLAAAGLGPIGTMLGAALSEWTSASLSQLWTSKVPRLAKSYGHWYHEQRGAIQHFSIDDDKTRLVVEENDVQEILSSGITDVSKLKARLSDHFLTAYHRMLGCSAAQLPTHEILAEPLTPLRMPWPTEQMLSTSDEKLSLPMAISHSRRADAKSSAAGEDEYTFVLESAPEAVTAYSMLFGAGTRIDAGTASATCGKQRYTAVEPRPYRHEFRFLTPSIASTVLDCTVTLVSCYVDNAAGEPATYQFTRSLVPKDEDGALVDVLRRAAFLALAKRPDDAPDSLPAQLQQQLLHLEQMVCMYSALGGNSSAKARLPRQCFEQPVVLEFHSNYCLSATGEPVGRSDPNSRVWLVEHDDGSVSVQKATGTLAGLRFDTEHVGGGRMKFVSRAARNVAAPARATAVDAVAAAPPDENRQRLALAWTVTGTVYFAPQFPTAKKSIHWGHIDSAQILIPTEAEEAVSPTKAGTGATAAARAVYTPVFPHQLSDDAVCMCSRILAGALLRDALGNEPHVRWKMIVDPQAYYTQEKTAPHLCYEGDVDNAEANWCNYTTHVQACLAPPSAALAAPGAESRPADTLERTLLQCNLGLPPIVELTALFDAWDTVAMHPDPPATRFFSAAMAAVMRVPLAVCHTGSKVQQASSWGDWVTSWFKNTDRCRLSANYYQRVVQLLMALKPDAKISELQDKANRILEETKEKRRDDPYAALQRALTLRELHNALIDYDQAPERQDLQATLHSARPSKAQSQLFSDRYSEQSRELLLYVYRVVLAVARLQQLVSRVDVIAVFGTQQLGKSTFLELLTGVATPKSDSNHTTEPQFAMAPSRGASSKVPLLCDLPGVDDPNRELQVMERLILGVANGVIVFNSTETGAHNQLDFRPLAALPKRTRVVVLLVMPNRRFLGERSIWQKEGDDVMVWQTDARGPMEWVVEWEAQQYATQENLAMLRDAADGALVYMDGTRLVVCVPGCTAPVAMNRCAAPKPLTGDVRACSTMTVRLRPQMAASRAAAVRSVASQAVCDELAAAIEALEGDDDDADALPFDWRNEHDAARVTEAAAAILHREGITLADSDAWVLDAHDAAARPDVASAWQWSAHVENAVSRATSGGSDSSSASTSCSGEYRYSLWRLQKLWRRCVDAFATIRADIERGLKKDVDVTGASFQVYVPVQPRGANKQMLNDDFYAAFGDRADTAQTQQLMLQQVRLRTNLEVMRRVKPDDVQLVTAAARDRDPADKKKGELLDAMFKRASCNVVLDQYDVVAFLGTQHGFYHQVSAALERLGDMSQYA